MFNARHLVRLLLAATVRTDAQAGDANVPLDANELLERSDIARGGSLHGVQLYSSVTEIRNGRAGPELRREIRLSPRQHRAADIATANYSRDYDAALVGEGTVDGYPVWVLDLKARTPFATCDRIRYYIDKEVALGIKAEYFAASGAVLKTARIEYDNHVRHNGRTVRFASRIEIADASDPSKHTVFKYWDVKVDALAAANTGESIHEELHDGYAYG